jgi:hypothetical protein
MTRHHDESQSILGDALDLAHADLDRYVVFPSPQAADAAALWVAATHCQEQWEHASRLVLKSPVKRCGKTRAAEIIRELASNALVAGSISAAALVRAIGTPPPTLILDEADTVFKKRADDAGEALRQILNLGHSRGWPYLRWDAHKKEMESCPTFAMALIAGIGSMPETIEDRAIVITMQRRSPKERVQPFRQRNVRDLHQVRFTLEQAVGVTLGGSDWGPPPELPVEDRAADVWEPLFVIAHAAGGDWPARCEAACIALVDDTDEEASLSMRLVGDLRAIWGADESHLATATILARLCDLEEAPWSNYYGRGMSPRDLAYLLRDFKVRSKSVRVSDGSTPKGYARDDLYPVWQKYANEPVVSPQPPQQPQTGRSSATRGPVASDDAEVADVADGGGRGSEWGELADVTTDTARDAIEVAQQNLRDAGIYFEELL